MNQSVFTPNRFFLLLVVVVFHAWGEKWAGMVIKNSHRLIISCWTLMHHAVLYYNRFLHDNTVCPVTSQSVQ